MATAPATVPYSAMFESAGTVAGAAASYTTTWDVTRWNPVPRGSLLDADHPVTGSLLHADPHAEALLAEPTASC